MPDERIETEILRVDAETPDATVIAKAAGVLRNGGLVAFPTETVYGLGANALDARAVARIFEAKGRPSNNPLIVHVPDAEAVKTVAAAWPEIAAKLAKAFWPGPLTLVLPKRENVPDIVTAGGPTVAVRVPAHPTARALLLAAGVPVAAPSANRSLRLSPTRAEHVAEGLTGRIEMLLDGGPTSGGLESTVLNLTTTPPQLLRPGLISPAEIEAVIGPITRLKPSPTTSESMALLSPGMLSRHYAPRAPLELATERGEERIQSLIEQGERVGWLTFVFAPTLSDKLTVIEMPQEAATYSARLYAALHELDAVGVTRIVVDMPPEGEDWLAVHDRLRRAATPTSG